MLFLLWGGLARSSLYPDHIGLGNWPHHVRYWASFVTLGCFVPWDILSLGMFCPWDVLSLGHFVPRDILSPGTFCLGTFCLCIIIQTKLHFFVNFFLNLVHCAISDWTRLGLCLMILLFEKTQLDEWTMDS